MSKFDSVVHTLSSSHTYSAESITKHQCIFNASPLKRKCSYRLSYRILPLNVTPAVWKLPVSPSDTLVQKSFSVPCCGCPSISCCCVCVCVCVCAPCFWRQPVCGFINGHCMLCLHTRSSTAHIVIRWLHTLLHSLVGLITIIWNLTGEGGKMKRCN